MCLNTADKSVLELAGHIVKGHQVASGLAQDSPYPQGSIALQMPFFKAAGLDLSGCYPATLNVSIAPSTFTLLKADFTINALTWIEGFPPETFSFVHCELGFRHHRYPAWIYYPHPETKTQHFHNASLLEVIAPNVPDIAYGSAVTLSLPSTAIKVSPGG